MASLKPHDHLCLIYESKEELFNVIVQFINAGLKKNEKCIYVIDKDTAEKMLEAFLDKGVDLSLYKKKEQFSFLYGKNFVNHKGYFDSDLMIKALINETNRALKQGYTSLRIVEAVSNSFNDQKNCERLIAYEKKLDEDLFQNYPCIAICQYDQGILDQDIVKSALLTHPFVIKDEQIFENIYYIESKEHLNLKKNGQELNNMLDNLKREKQLKNDMQRDKEHLNTIFKSVGEAVIVTDTTGRITRMNPVAEKITGWKFEEAKEKKLNEIFNITDASTGEKAECPLKKVIKEDKNMSFSRPPQTHFERW